MKINQRYFLLLLLHLACHDEKTADHSTDKLFTRLGAEETGIHFINQLEDTEDFDVFRYRNYYNGGGVAIGDINRDDLPDIFLTSNTGGNKLYLNKGNFHFEDVTAQAQVAGSKPWSTGVAMADVNGDGWLDIYVCNSGDIDGENMENELFINNGDGTFVEMAKKFGLDDPGYSTHAVFFDFDGDGDLDCYLLNNSFRPISTLGYRNLRDQRDPKGGDKLFRNDGGKFIDISEAAGIYGSVIGFGLGVSVGDIDKDGDPDLFISNDFYERDYLYINQGDGTFKESLTEYMDHISMFSMGADIGDINNDGFPEIFTTDMLPESDHRLKTMTAFETFDVHQLRVNHGYYHQYMRNTLQLNREGKYFSEIGYLANLAATDWSWGALIVDLNNSGTKEVFVSNGIFKDVTNQDFIEYLANEEKMKAAIAGEKVDFKDFVDKMPSEKLSNYAFVQEKPLQFTNRAKEWGLAEPSFSNGAAYGDLDGDGDLDLVVNNVNQELFVYRNNSERDFPDHNFIAFTFEGYGKNPFGLGAHVNLFRAGEIFYYEHMPIRGFQSSMDYKMIIGLGKQLHFDSLSVTWPDGKKQTITHLELNTTHSLSYKEAKTSAIKPVNNPQPILKTVDETGIDFVHTENDFNEFDRERLIYQMLSTEGPAFATADLDGNGTEDFFIGGAKDQEGAVYLQQPAGKFTKLASEAIKDHIDSEDVAAVFFDANNDGKQDLLVISGGSEFTGNSPQLRDRLYINQAGNPALPELKHETGALPANYAIGSVAAVHDIDGDGFLDIFIGARKHNSYYGPSPSHQILINDGTGHFTDMTNEIAPDLQEVGMVKDAMWIDLKGRGAKSLVLVGDWMPITVFENFNGRLVKQEITIENLPHHGGWWNKILSADFNKDGLPDLVIGNAGLNCRFKPGTESPVSLYVNDFDNNGSIEQIHTYRKNSSDYPIHTRHELVKQMVFLKKKFRSYEAYAGKSMEEIFGKPLVEKARVLTSHIGETILLLNQGNGHFSKEDLPLETQFTTIKAMEVLDLNKDGHQDILLAGNFFDVKPELGRFDASKGITLIGNGKGGFSTLPFSQSGFIIPGQTRHVKKLNSTTTPYLIAIRNNDAPMVFKMD